MILCSKRADAIEPTDVMVARLSRQPRLPLLLLASSPVAFSFLLRTFSNPLETLFLAALYLEYSDLKSSRQAMQLGALGAVLAAGIFTRSTFAAFALPILLFLAWRVATHKPDGSTTSCATIQRSAIDSSKADSLRCADSLSPD